MVAPSLGYRGSTPPLAPRLFPTNPAPISAGHPRLSVGHMSSRGCPTGQASCRWTQPRCPTSRSRADALRATTSQLSGRAEPGVSRELTVKVAAAFPPSF